MSVSCQILAGRCGIHRALPEQQQIADGQADLIDLAPVGDVAVGLVLQDGLAALLVRAGHDGTGTCRAVARITSGRRWKPVQDPVVCRGQWDDSFVDQAKELGTAMAAGLELGVFLGAGRTARAYRNGGFRRRQKRMVFDASCGAANFWFEREMVRRFAPGFVRAACFVVVAYRVQAVSSALLKAGRADKRPMRFASSRSLPRKAVVSPSFEPVP